MKHLNKYEMINESLDWVVNAASSLSYNRDAEIQEFFLELSDLGGQFKGVKNQTHSIVDKNFLLKDRINYVSEPLYQSYLVRIRFNDLANTISRGGIDVEMEKTIDFFNELDDAFNHLKDFGYKFILRAIEFKPRMTISDDSIMIDVVVYHPEDIVPWEKIFTKE